MIDKNEAVDIERMLEKIYKHRVKNLHKLALYEGKNIVQDLGISVPRRLRSLAVATGWGRVAVDSLAERVVFEGWKTTEEESSELLHDTFEQNFMLTEAKSAVLDAFRFGVGFLSVSEGDEDELEPAVLVHSESPLFTTVNYNLRTRRASSALKITGQDKDVVLGTYFTESEIIEFKKSGGYIFELGRVEHGLKRVPIVPIFNRRESGSGEGHSEITPSITNLINSVMRTLLGAEIAREYYSAPQRYLLNAPEEAVIDADGNAIDPISFMMNQILVMTANPNPQAPSPQIGSFTTNSPTAAIEMIKTYAEFFCSETGIPQHYLGFTTQNPASAEAIRASENRLISKAEDRIDSFAKAFTEVGTLIQLVSGGTDEISIATPRFRAVGTSVLGATVDALTKLVSIGTIVPDSEIAYRMLGFDASDIATVRAEIAAKQAEEETKALLEQAIALGRIEDIERIEDNGNNDNN